MDKKLTDEQIQELAKELQREYMRLNDEMNKVLDEIVAFIDSKANEEKKVANKKQAPQKQPKTEKTEVQVPEKQSKTKKPFNRVSVGDVVKFQVEGEKVQHEILIIYKGRNHLIGIMKEDEKEVFLIRKTDFNKKIFEWKDRKGENYNIIVTIE